jgi:hypothetical protein
MNTEFARLILEWHARFGIEKAHVKLPKERFLEYNRALEGFLHRREIFDPALVHDIAKCQSSGIFESFFCEPVPVSMLEARELPISRFHGEAITLGQIARMILASEDEARKFNEDTKVVFELPSGWGHNPTPLKPSSKVVAHGKIADAVRREFAEPLSALKAHGFGGVGLMVSLHESASKHHHESAAKRMADQTCTTIYNPASFGLQLASGDGTLVSAITSGRVRVGHVMVGVKAGWAVEHTEETQDGHNRRD